MKTAASVIVTLLTVAALYWATTASGEVEQAQSAPLLEAVPTTAQPVKGDVDGRDPYGEPLTYTSPTSTVSAPATTESSVAPAAATNPGTSTNPLTFETHIPEPQATFEAKPRYSSTDRSVRPIGLDGQTLQACLDGLGIDPYGDNSALIDEVGQEVFDDMLGTCVFGSVVQP